MSYSAYLPSTVEYYTFAFEVTDKVLTVRYGSELEDTPLVQWTDEGAAHQQFRFTEVADEGWYRVRARHSGHYLAVEDGSTANRAAVVLVSGSGSESAHWRLEEVEDGVLVLRNRHSNRLLDLQGGKQEDGARVIQYSTTSGSNRRLLLVASRPVAEPFSPEPDCSYVITFLHSGKVLGVADKSREEGAQVQQWTRDDDFDQKFTFEEVDEGWYQIRARHSDKVLSLKNGSTGAGTKVVQAAPTGEHHQHWRVVPHGDAYAIESRAVARVLDISGGRSAPVSWALSRLIESARGSWLH